VPAEKTDELPAATARCFAAIDSLVVAEEGTLAE
jgi:hypothetical protein